MLRHATIALLLTAITAASAGLATAEAAPATQWSWHTTDALGDAALEITLAAEAPTTCVVSMRMAGALQVGTDVAYAQFFVHGENDFFGTSWDGGELAHVHHDGAALDTRGLFGLDDDWALSLNWPITLTTPVRFTLYGTNLAPWSDADRTREGLDSGYESLYAAVTCDGAADIDATTGPSYPLHERLARGGTGATVATQAGATIDATIAADVAGTGVALLRWTGHQVGTLDLDTPGGTHAWRVTPLGMPNDASTDTLVRVESGPGPWRLTHSHAGAYYGGVYGAILDFSPVVPA